MKHHYFKAVILKACLLRNTENIDINCSNTSPIAFWTWHIFITVILGGKLDKTMYSSGVCCVNNFINR